MMYYVYVLLSEMDGNFYTGFTSDLKRRIIEHQNGETKSTKHRRPLELVYYEACRSRFDAMKREKYLKTTYGHRYLKNRLSNDIWSDE
jgi:putative endonuclease